MKKKSNNKIRFKRRQPIMLCLWIHVNGTLIVNYQLEDKNFSQTQSSIQTLKFNSISSFQTCTVVTKRISEFNNFANEAHWAHLQVNRLSYMYNANCHT